MHIKQSQIIDPSASGEVPDAIKIDVAGMRFLVNRHTGAVTIEGAEHVEVSEGANNTLEIHACPNLDSMHLQMLELPWVFAVARDALFSDHSRSHAGMRGRVRPEGHRLIRITRSPTSSPTARAPR